jgi:signal transduction histidine kinase
MFHKTLYRETNHKACMITQSPLASAEAIAVLAERFGMDAIVRPESVEIDYTDRLDHPVVKPIDAEAVYLNPRVGLCRWDAPVAAILGLAVTLERADLELETEDSRDMAKRIAVNARKLDRMVSDLLDLDRLARGIVEPRRHATDVGALVRRVIDESDLAARGAEVHAPELVANVDPAKVERIVENLLANTLRHTPRDTQVWVRVERTDAGVLIVVEDDGPGVPEAHREAIFEPFRQGPDAPEHSPGVGVGLALVARFAELLGGRAWVQDREGGGASFRVLVADEPATAPDTGPTG